MTGYAGLIQQGLFFGGILVLLTAGLTAACYPILRNRMQRCGPHARASLLLGLCVFPMASTFTVLFAALLPSLLQLLGFENDHCLGHADGHRHFCLIHRPTLLDSQRVNFIALMFLLLVALVGTRVLLDIIHTWRFRKAMGKWQVVDSELPISIMATDIPVAFTSGIFSPRIFLSTGLLRSLTAEEKSLLIAHEKAHVRRFDGLKSLLARSLSIAQLPWVRTELLAQLHLASEQACDEAAATQADGRHRIAELLLKIERLYQQHFPARSPLVLHVLGDRGSTLPARIQALLAPANGNTPRQPLALALFSCGLLAIAGHDFLHDWLEHALHLFNG